MKIGHSQDHISLCFTQDEYKKFLRGAECADGRLRCYGTLDAFEEVLRITFGDRGRVFSKTDGSDLWRVQLDDQIARANRLPLFGLTPTTYSEVNKWQLLVAIPQVTSPPKKRRELKTQIVNPNYRVVPREVAQYEQKHTPAPVSSEPVRPPYNEELLLLKRLYNNAISFGYKPTLDGRGQILYFDAPRVGADFQD